MSKKQKPCGHSQGAIAIRVREIEERTTEELLCSKFFGIPALPLAWKDDFDEDVLFFCQICLEDIAPWDTENRLLHTGYLYVFLDISGGRYAMKPIVRYSAAPPEMVIDDFNAEIDEFGDVQTAWAMEFAPAANDKDCTRLFGVPSDWNYAENAPALFMQFDPLDSGMDFLQETDGYLYLFFGKDEKKMDRITLHLECS